MLKNKILFWMSGLIFAHSFLSAQGIIGAEIVKNVTSFTAISVEIYRIGEPSPFIIFDWGDGILETIPISSSGSGTINGIVRIDKYYSTHQYDTTGYISIGFIDSFLLPGVSNIPNSELVSIRLGDTILVSSDFPNNSPDFHSYQTQIWFEENKVKHRVPFGIDWLIPGDFIKAELIPFPSEGFYYPEAFNTLEINGQILTWDQPLVPGLYALGYQFREYRPIAENGIIVDTILLSTTLRAMMINIDSFMVVSTMDPWVSNLFSVYPNPASEVIHIQCSTPGEPAEIHIHDITGKKWFVQNISKSARVESLEVDVRDWPPGVYLVSLVCGGQRVVRKFTVF